jgi:hypothetical protein
MQARFSTNQKQGHPIATTRSATGGGRRQIRRAEPLAILHGTKHKQIVRREHAMKKSVAKRLVTAFFFSMMHVLSALI